MVKCILTNKHSLVLKCLSLIFQQKYKLFCVIILRNLNTRCLHKSLTLSSTQCLRYLPKPRVSLVFCGHVTSSVTPSRDKLISKVVCGRNICPADCYRSVRFLGRTLIGEYCQLLTTMGMMLSTPLLFQFWKAD